MDATQLELIRDVAGLTGAAPPDWTATDAPMLQAPTLQNAGDSAVYLIGVIGGKDVGKSSLVNALLGQAVAGVSAHGEGTRRALAYTHEADAVAVRRLLDTHAAGEFDVVPHTIDTARGRVLLDLPDIDSVWSTHADLTRRLLRHMLFPIWVQSIEKYADHQPLDLLAKVAAGNSPKNFLFVLTKADVLARRHGAAAVDELRADYAARVSRACGLDVAPRVFAVNSTGRPTGEFDLPGLRETVLAVRSERDLAGARQLARQQQAKTLSTWLAQQRVDERLAAAKRLLTEAEALVATRLAEPLTDRVAERLCGDGRGDLVEPAVRRRLSYWPVVNVIDGVLGPVVSAVRGRTDSLAAPPAGHGDVGRQVRGVFAELAGRDPQVLTLYGQAKLWESDPAAVAADALDLRLESAVAAHREKVRQAAGRPVLLVRLLAPFVTLGAAVWFPIAQPVLELFLSGKVTELSRASLLLVVQLLGAEYLIRSVGMLAIYFLALWLLLRWAATRNVERALRRATDADHPAAAVLEWASGLLTPLRKQVERLTQLKRRIADAGMNPHGGLIL